MLQRFALCLMTLFLPFSIAWSQTPQSSVVDYSIDDAGKMVGDAKGDFVVFHLYASWCPPCRDEIPALIRICERYKNHPFRMLAFSVDRSGADLQTFLSAQKVNFEHRRLSTALTQTAQSPLRALGINYQNSIPFTAVFDPSGKLIKQWSGAKSHASYVTLLDEAFLAAPPAEAKDPAPLPPVVQKPEATKTVVSIPVAASPAVPIVAAKPKQQTRSGSAFISNLLIVLTMFGIGIGVALFVFHKRKNYSSSVAERLRWRLND